MEHYTLNTGHIAPCLQRKMDMAVADMVEAWSDDALQESTGLSPAVREAAPNLKDAQVVYTHSDFGWGFDIGLEGLTFTLNLYAPAPTPVIQAMADELEEALKWPMPVPEHMAYPTLITGIYTPHVRILEDRYGRDVAVTIMMDIAVLEQSIARALHDRKVT